MKAPSPQAAPLPLPKALVFVAVAATAFQLASASAATGFLIFAYLFCLVQLTRVRTDRQAFYCGLTVGFLIAMLNLTFLWTIFSAAAIALWLVFALWIGLFVVLAWYCRKNLGPIWSALLIPFLWTGLEYFRSELYGLRFSWLSAGYAFSGTPSFAPLHALGIYGVGTLAVAIVIGASFLKGRARLLSVAPLLLLWFGLSPLTQNCFPGRTTAQLPNLNVAGVQLEFPTDSSVIFHLTKLIKKYPEAELLVLSEYTFDGPVPDKVRDWCREHGRYLIVGGKDPATNGNFYNTVFVIGPAGDVVFKQAKSVPIQFFKDGLPAPGQIVWNSPWGKIGICVCYDLSYARVIDRFVRQGAQLIIAPTMDVESWGRRQHELHARVAPIRAAEYGIPIFRVCSSGISQSVDRYGRVVASAGFPGDGAMISGLLTPHLGGLPADRWLAPLAVAVTAIAVVILLLLGRMRAPRKERIPTPTSPTPEQS
jgi:apolipoprotein N-acyltransferase